MPWILCGPGRPPESTGERGGLDGDDRAASGLRSFRKRAGAGDRAAGADAGDEVVDVLPSSASHSSGPVVRRCASGLAGLENWSGSQTSSSRASAWAAATASFMPPIDSVMWTCAP